MSSTVTNNLGLFKATPGSAEPFRTTDYNASMDKIDKAIGLPYVDFTAFTLNNATTEQQLMGAPIGPALQGSAWKMTASGTFGHTAVSTTLTLRIRFGGTTVVTTVITTPASALAGRVWRVDCELICLTTGGSGTWKISGVTFATVNTTDTPFIYSPTPFTKDTTVAQTLEISAQWGAASASNTIVIDAGMIWRITNG